MSVDTYLKGKDTSAYQRVADGDVEVLLAPALVRVSDRIAVATKGAAFWRGFDVTVEHDHGGACSCAV